MARIAILGCGPAGLLAAHAVEMAGHSASVISNKRKSPMGGAQFLHVPIPYLTSCDGDPVTVWKEGTALGYARKVYGEDDMEARVSFEKYASGQVVPAWDLTKLYDVLWDRFSDRIVDMSTAGGISASNVGSIVMDSMFDMVVSTISAQALCTKPGEHRFNLTAVMISLGLHSEVAEGEIWYDGDEDTPWYRQSRLWGFRSTEWALGHDPVDQTKSGPLVRVDSAGHKIIQVVKPVDTECTCWSEEITRLGRYGQWDKRVLTHDAFSGMNVAMAHRGLIQEARV